MMVLSAPKMLEILNKEVLLTFIRCTMKNSVKHTVYHFKPFTTFTAAIHKARATRLPSCGSTHRANKICAAKATDF